MTMPAHVRQMLENNGTIGRDGSTRRARAHRCTRCHQPVMTGDDADMAAVSATVDVTPINPLGELHALINGHSTYSLTWRGNRYEIDHRDQDRIRGKPAGTFDGDVLRSHKCEMPPVPEEHSALTKIREQRKAQHDSDAPPPF